MNNVDMWICGYAHVYIVICTHKCMCEDQILISVISFGVALDLKLDDGLVQLDAQPPPHIFILPCCAYRCVMPSLDSGDLNTGTDVFIANILSTESSP